MSGKKRFWGFWILGFICLLAIGMVYFRGYWFPLQDETSGAESGPDAVIENYGKDILRFAGQFDVPPEFAAALCMLECAGRKPVKSRFEKHVYLKLKLVKLHMRKQYEHVTADDLDDAGEEAMENLASSWGPFQLMGYKCLLYDIRVKDLRGDSGVYWALKWMQENYGTYLRKKDYKSAFHIHNAGTPWPKTGKPATFHPDYVPDGLKWMAYFRKKLK